MSQRQKKKASQGKKRYYEAAKKHETQSKTSQNTQKQDDGRGVKVPATAHPSSPEGQAPSPRKAGKDDHSQQKSYSKRKITSNWGRYDEGDDVDRSGDYPHTSQTEEELQQRLLQLFNLPTNQSVSTPLNSEFSPPDIKETPQYITLDCNSLAESLACLPVHQRLGLSTELLELGGYSIHTGSENSVMAQERTQFENPTPGLPKEQVVSSGSGGITAEASTHQISAQGIGSGKTGEEQGQERFDFKPHTPAATAECTVAPDVEDDSELDQLLSEPAAAPSEGLSGTEKPKESHEPQTAVTQETDELDDMLDELLA